MRYKVISDQSLFNLEREINNHIKSGWKVQGGISVSFAKYNGGNDELRYFQALITE